MRVLVHGSDEALTSDVAAHLERLGRDIDHASGGAGLFSEVGRCPRMGRRASS